MRLAIFAAAIIALFVAGFVYQSDTMVIGAVLVLSIAMAIEGSVFFGLLAILSVIYLIDDLLRRFA